MILTAPEFDRLNQKLTHGFTTREPGNDYAKIADQTGLVVRNIFYLEQIHSADVISVRKTPDQNCLGKADAIVTDVSGIMIGVKTADCIPLLACGLGEKGRPVIASIHAGWRGVLRGIIQNTMHVMVTEFGCMAGQINFVFGPCLRVKNFEFGFDDIALLEKRYPQEIVFQDYLPERPRLDLVATAKNILMNLGCDAQKIHDINLCTYERQDLFHSYRRGKLKGRQFSFVHLQVRDD